MKKHLFFSALAALALSSCMKENQTIVPGGIQTVTFDAVASVDTRTALVEGTKVYWQSGDQISVSGAAAPFTNALAAGETAASTAFTGEVAAADTYYAVYPAEGVTWNGSVATIKSTMRQQAVNGTFAAGVNITAANTTSQDKSFSFKNMLGYVKLSLPVGIESVIVTANGGEELCGELSIDCSVPGATVKSGTGSNCVTLFDYTAIPEGVYYIALAPGTYSEGLTFDFVGTDGKVATKTVAGPIELEAGHINPLGTITGLTWNDPAEGLEGVIWKGKYVTGKWDAGMSDLTSVYYDWSGVKAGDVLKVYGGSTNPAVPATMSLKNKSWTALAGAQQFYNNPPAAMSVTLTEEMVADLKDGGLIIQGDGYYCTAVAVVPGTGDVEPDGPQIPENYVAITLWEGTKDMAWGTAMQDLAYGGYNWANCKPGQYLKIYVTPTNPDANWTVQLMYADDAYAWQAIPSFTNYDNVEEIIFELTEELIALFAAPNNGFIMQGNNATAKKVELYRESTGQSGFALTMTNDVAEAEDWSVQVWYTLDQPLKAGSQYEFKCVAKSTVARDWMTMVLQSGEADAVDQNYSHGMNLFTDWTPTTITILPDKDTYVKLTFNIGNFLGTVSIDNVSMKEVGTDVELIKNGDFENGSTIGWSSWTGAHSIGEGYAE